MVRVLVVGASPRAVDGASRVLRAAGHETVHCHAVDEPPFPCAALVESGQCPLETDPVDVVLDMHERPSHMPSRAEDGVMCGLRRGIPLVVSGSPVHPYQSWVNEEIGPCDDLVAACESAVSDSEGQRAEGETALDAARAALVQAGIDPGGARATVHRRETQAHVLLELPPRPPGVHAAIVTRVTQAVHALDPAITEVDVSIV
jgi:hypothetical protein